MAKRKRTHRRTAHAVAPRRRHAVRRHHGRRHYRRNPPLMAMAQQALVDGALVTAGTVAVRLVPQYLPDSVKKSPSAGHIALALEAVAAVAAGYAAHKVGGQNAGRMVAAGGIAAVMQTALKSANVPVVSAALAGNDDVLALSGYPMAGYPQMSGYDAPPVLAARSFGDAGDEFEAATY